MLKHFESELGIGVFDYDTDIFNLDDFVLKKREDYKGPISLPKGLKSCKDMFKNMSLEGCWFEDFDTTDVEDMKGMFYRCSLPEGFTLGNNFNTSKVENMNGIFWGCSLPKGFSLGDKFDTSNVRGMAYAFCECSLPEGFSLGDKFNTSKVKYMNWMFHKCSIPEGFSLGDKFNTVRVFTTSHMFDGCTIPKGFSLGDKFDTSNVTDTSYMFKECKIPVGFSLGNKFDTSNVREMNSMFNTATLPEGFTLGDKFNTSNVEDMTEMFCNCKIQSGFSLGDKFSIKNVRKGNTWNMFGNVMTIKGLFPTTPSGFLPKNVAERFVINGFLVWENLELDTDKLTTKETEVYHRTVKDLEAPVKSKIVGNVSEGITDLEKILIIMKDKKFGLCIGENGQYLLVNLWFSSYAHLGTFKLISKSDYIRETKNYIAKTGKKISTGPKIKLKEYFNNKECQLLFDWYISKFPQYCLKYKKETEELYLCKRYDN